MLTIHVGSGIVQAIFTVTVEIIVISVILTFLTKKNLSFWACRHVEKGNTIYFGPTKESLSKIFNKFFVLLQLIFVALIFWAELGINGDSEFVYEERPSLRLGGESWIQKDALGSSIDPVFTHFGVSKLAFGNVTKCTKRKKVGFNNIEINLYPLHVEQKGGCVKDESFGAFYCKIGAYNCDSKVIARLLVVLDQKNLFCNSSKNWIPEREKIVKFNLDGCISSVKKISYGNQTCSGELFSVEKYEPESKQGNNKFDRFMWIAESEIRGSWKYVLWHMPATENRFFVEYTVESKYKLERTVLAAAVRSVDGGAEMFDQDFIDIFYSQAAWLYESESDSTYITPWSAEQLKQLKSKFKFPVSERLVTQVNVSYLIPLLITVVLLTSSSVALYVYIFMTRKEYNRHDFFSVDWLSGLFYQSFRESATDNKSNEKVKITAIESANGREKYSVSSLIIKID